MGLLIMLTGVIMFFFSLDIAFSDRFGKTSKNFVPVILILSIGLFCIGIVFFNQGSSGKSDRIAFKYGSATPGNQGGSQTGETFDGANGESTPKYSKEDIQDGDNDGSKQKPKGWANGLGGTFEKWKDLFGPPDEVELVNETGKATFQEHYLQANFTHGKASSFSLDFQKIDAGGYELNKAKDEINQLIPPDSKMIGSVKSDDGKIVTEQYESKMMEKELSELDNAYFGSGKDIKRDLFYINYHILDSGKIYKADVGTGLNIKPNK